MNVTKESLLSKLSKRRDCYWGVGSLGTYVNESQQVWNLDTDLWHLLATLGIAQPNSSAPFPTFLEPCVELEKALRGACIISFPTLVSQMLLGSLWMRKEGNNLFALWHLLLIMEAPFNYLLVNCFCWFSQIPLCHELLLFVPAELGRPGAELKKLVIVRDPDVFFLCTLPPWKEQEAGCDRKMFLFFLFLSICTLQRTPTPPALV